MLMMCRNAGFLLCAAAMLSHPVGAQEPLASEQEAFALDQSELRAQLSPVRHAMLAAELGGKVNRVAVREGQAVEKGQILLEFDCSLQAAQLQKARAQLAGANNTYNGSKRMAELNAIGSVELNNSKVEVDKAKADVSYLNATINRCTLNAPYAGVIGEKQVREQEFVQPGQPLLEILDNSALELQFIVPSRWLSWLVPGYAFHVQIEDTGATYPVKLSYTGAKVDPLSQSIKAVAVVDGKFDELLPGMSGHLLLSAPE